MDGKLIDRRLSYIEVQEIAMVVFLDMYVDCVLPSHRADSA